MLRQELTTETLEQQVQNPMKLVLAAKMARSMHFQEGGGMARTQHQRFLGAVELSRHFLTPVLLELQPALAF